jgi:hypothetical protein
MELLIFPAVSAVFGVFAYRRSAERDRPDAKTWRVAALVAAGATGLLLVPVLLFNLP